MNKNTPEPVRVRFSIARRLNSKLFFRLLGLFVSLDIMICLFTCAALLVYSERTAATVAGDLESIGGYSSEPTEIPALPGVEISLADGVPGGARVFRPFSHLLPDATAGSPRGLSFQNQSPATLTGALYSLRYHVFYNNGTVTYDIAVGYGLFLKYFTYAFFALTVYEFLVLLTQISKDRRMIRRTLDPISALAEAAESLNRAENQFDPDKMAALAYKLEGITASRLDTRIQVDETQAELKNLALAINGMLDRINESYRAQVRFVSDASHELRTPISVIQGYANLLDRWGKNDEKTLQESITAIKDEAANMKDLVEQLLFLARGDNNTIMMQVEPFDLAALAGEVMHETQMIDSTHRFELRASEVGVTADRALIKQALRILVDNAIKYTDAGGSIAVNVESDNDFAQLSVTDDGIGIRPEAVPQVFDRFYRADESRARATGGAGLGLSIAKWIATRHGGHMEVLSRVGIGTKITIALPITAQPVKLAVSPPVPADEEIN